MKKLIKLLIKILFSPFKFPKIKVYTGKIRVATPYFYPRVFVKVKGYDNNNTAIGVPKRFGFDIVNLGYKTKWSDDDFRYEYPPIISFVFLKWQIAFTFFDSDCYWETWLHYENLENKKMSKIERINTCCDIMNLENKSIILKRKYI